MFSMLGRLACTSGAHAEMTLRTTAPEDSVGFACIFKPVLAKATSTVVGQGWWQWRGSLITHQGDSVVVIRRAGQHSFFLSVHCQYSLMLPSRQTASSSGRELRDIR